jgi:hypothetical protein
MRRRGLAGALAGLAAASGLAACGSAAHTSTAPASTTTSAATTTTGGDPAGGLTAFLLRAGEEKGVPPAPGGGTFATLGSWVAFTQLTAADARVLRAEGFVAAAQENLGGSGIEGASFVEEFTSADGARREAINDARQSTQGGGEVRFFSVPGLANAHGVLVAEPGDVGTDLYWTEGRCTLWVGNGASGTLEPQVVAGARAIDHRTGGKCP